jgi:hypothetical protein
VALSNDSQVQPASFGGAFASDVPRVVVRAKADDLHQPMPIGNPPKNGSAAIDQSFMGPNSQPVAVPSVTDLGPGYDLGGGPPCSFDVCAPAACCPTDAFCCPNLGGQPRCFWTNAELLFWGIKDSRVPPLVTTSAPGTTPAGALGPGTAVLFGGDKPDTEDFMGARFGGGFWLDPCHTLALEGNFFFLASRSNNFVNGSTGLPILARPFFDSRGFENAQLVAFPNMVQGTVAVASSSSLWGAEANVRWHGWDGCAFCGTNYRIDLLGGLRYLELEERLAITEALFVPPGATARGAAGPAGIFVFDRFKTRNQFYGAQVGAEAELKHGCWFLDVTAKIGLGNVHQRADINGSTTFTAVGVSSSTAAGGLLAQPTNIGAYSHDRLAFLPEFGLKLGYQITDHLRVYLGYNFLYLNNVARPGDQIDRTINVTQIPNITSPPTGEPVVGVRRPVFVFRQTDFWAQGANIGLEFRYYLHRHALVLRHPLQIGQ